MATYYLQARTKSGAEYDGKITDLNQKEVDEVLNFIKELDKMNQVSLELANNSHISIKGDSIESLALLKL